MSALAATSTTTMARPSAAGSQRDVTLVDLLDRLLAGGVVLAADIKLALADIDLVQVELRALISSIRDDQWR